MKRTVVADRFFLDSNVLLYSLRIESPKASRALELIKSGGAIISTQVLNEFFNVASKKYKMLPGEIVGALQPIKHVCTVVSLTIETHERAATIFGETNFGIYDCNIIAAAELSGCNILYTEDMNHGQRFGRVEIRNPFMVET
jgi:predicted nucleic acid-binding protein